jgi:GDPmannose 4,6-dehydratase
MKKAFITGITGQDGSYWEVLLRDKGYKVHGIVRRSAEHTRGRIDHLRAEKRIIPHRGDFSKSETHSVSGLDYLTHLIVFW